jgi:hypothetical protein
MIEKIEAENEELRAKIRDMEKALGIKDQDVLLTFKLNPSLNSIFGLLLHQKLVTAEMIEQRLRLATEAKVAVHRLRQALKPWSIEVESRRNIGYWLSPETKARIRELISGEVTNKVIHQHPDSAGAMAG